MPDKPPQNPVTKALQEAMAQHSFPTIESAQTFANNFLAEYNRCQLDDFHGLTPDQMRQILYAPFDSPGMVTFQEKTPLSACSNSPMCWLFLHLIDAIGEDGVKATAKGNLPRALCRELAEIYRSKFRQDGDGWYGPISTETDFMELHIVHMLARLAGFIRKYKGKIIVSKKYQQLRKKDDGEGVYPALLECYIRKFNWAYWDGYPDSPFVQHSFLFTLYLLTKYGNEQHSDSFYADAFLTAFPMLLNEMPEQGYYSTGPAETAENLYTYRCLRRFAVFTGLASLQFKDNPNKTGYLDRYLVSVQKTPLLDLCWLFKES